MESTDGAANVLIIGAGGVAAAAAHKCAQHNHRLGDICIASRSRDKCDAIISSIRARRNLRDGERRLRSAEIEARDSEAVARLIDECRASIVLNVASPYCNLGVLHGVLAAGAHYIDTAVHENPGQMNMPPPWYAAHEWPLREDFAAAGLTAILGMGFDPGAVNAFCAWAARHHFERIDRIDILDVNGGDHGRYFATNFDPETNLREILEDALWWERGHWRRAPHHSVARDFDFPALGRHRLYAMGHDEVHSLATHFPGAERVAFWMAFGERYLRVFEVLKELGLLANTPLSVPGARDPVQPIQFLKALLPDPASLAEGYRGAVDIGVLVEGEREGAIEQCYVHSGCRHEDAWQDVGAQAISYTTAVPLVSAALLVADGRWRVGRMVNVEELEPLALLATMTELGIGWAHERREEPLWRQPLDGGEPEHARAGG